MNPWAAWLAYLIWWIQYGRREQRHTAIKYGGKVVATAILMDDQNENLTLALVDDAGNPVGALPPGVTVAWAVKANGVDASNNPLASAPVALTPSADTLSCNMKAAGMLATGTVISAVATLPPATTPEEADLTVNVVVSAATGFSIVPGTPAHN
jgi:hypothetical protein